MKTSVNTNKSTENTTMFFKHSLRRDIPYYVSTNNTIYSVYSNSGKIDTRKLCVGKPFTEELIENGWVEMTPQEIEDLKVKYL